MSKFGFIQNDCVSKDKDAYDPCCDKFKPKPGPCSCKFLSCYIEAQGSAQTVENGGAVAFDSDPDSLDTTGVGIELDRDNNTFTITRPGLYAVNWSINIQQGAEPVVLGLMENGLPSSGSSNFALTGNHASGALINVTKDNIPYTISLHNFGAGLQIGEPDQFENTAVSMRIFRFADGVYTGR